MRAPRIVFEGPNGTGKTTLISYIEPVLNELGYKTVVHTQPSDKTEGGKKAKWLFENRIFEDPEFFDSKLLHALMSDRLELSLIEKPLLENGFIVLSSRCWISSYVYQGFLGTISLNEWSSAYDSYKHNGGLDPDISVFLMPDTQDTELCYSRSHPEGSRVESLEHYRDIVSTYQFAIDHRSANCGKVLQFTNRTYKEAIANTLVWAIRVFFKKQLS